MRIWAGVADKVTDAERAVQSENAVEEIHGSIRQKSDDRLQKSVAEL